MKRTCSTLVSSFPAAALALCLLLPMHQAYAKRESANAPMAVVMEESTVRGKVVILETRKEDRKVVADIRIQVWSTPDPNSSEKQKLLFETTTDEGGQFTLPDLKIGRYVLTVSKVNLNLSVVPKTEDAQGQVQAKVLLILLPKDVV